MRITASASVVLAVQAMPAAAQTMLAIGFPAGSAGQQLLALGTQARVGISVPDAGIWSRPVPALHGRMTLAQALRRIASAAGAEVVPIGPGSYRIVARASRPRPQKVPPQRRSPLPSAPPVPPAAADIVVTASKRGVSRRDFPGQLSWVGGAELDFGGPAGTDRLIGRLTSVASTYLGTGRNKLFIRGIADSSFTGVTQPTVGQYFGDLRLNYTGPDPDLRLIDLAGVEVLEGPQGTLYGAGSLGGLIRLVPNATNLSRTTASLGFGVSLTAGGAPGADLQGMLNLPVVDGRLGIRLAGIVQREGGYIDKPLLDRRDANRTDVAGGRTSVRADLGDGWTADLIGMGQRIHAADSQYANRTRPALVNRAPVAEGASAGFAQVQVAFGGPVGNLRFLSTTGVTATDIAERYDATAEGTPPRLFTQAGDTRMIANETRLWRPERDGFGWLVGVSLVRNRGRTERRLGAPGNQSAPVAVVNHANEATVYGEASYRVLPRLRATFGARLSHMTLTGFGRGERDPADPDVPANAAAPLRDTRLVALPSASLLYDVSDAATAFVRIQQGFRPGGLAIINQTARSFQGDRVDTIEAGIRAVAGGSARPGFSLTLAHTSWNDIQADFLDRTGLPGTANIGDGEILTFEATASISPVRHFRLSASATYNESTLGVRGSRRGTPPGGDEPLPEDLSAGLERIPNVAPFTARLGAAFDRTADSGDGLTIDGWVRYVGSSNLGIGPILGRSQGRYVDSALTGRLTRGKLGWTIGLTNLSNSRGNRFALGTPFTTGRSQITPLRPRTLRIGLDAAF